jgi:preprotein translocase subunit YajC
LQGALSLIFLIVMVAIFYLLLIRPQKKKLEQHRQLVESIDTGDQVVTIGGLFGHITDEDDETFELEIALGTRVRLLKSAVARKVEELDETEEAEDEDDEDLEEVTGEEET